MQDLVYVGGVLTVHAAAATLPTPTLPSDGADLSPLTTGVVNLAGDTQRALPETCVWYLDNAGTLTGAVLWAFFDGAWYPTGPLKAGTADIVGNDSGRVDMGAGWDRVRLVGSPGAPVTFRLVREERGIR